MSEQAWARAYLKQARADFSMFLKLKDDEQVDLCHTLHFLQMATEKLSKAALLLGGGYLTKDVYSTHFLFVRMLNKFKKHSGVADLLVRGNTAALELHIRSILPFAAWIERLVPTDIDTPNAEYPWFISDSTAKDEPVVAPCDHPFSVWNPADRKTIQMLKMIKRVLDNAEDIFG